MDFYQDERSFLGPLKEAFAAVEAELLAAGATVAGAYGRTAAAVRAKRDLYAFKERVRAHIEAGDFVALPRLRSRLVPIRACHHLTVGEWRGVFLVSPEAAVTVAVLFSRAPHDVSGRLDEAVARHRPALAGGEEAADDDPS